MWAYFFKITAENHYPIQSTAQLFVTMVAMDAIED